ncbi:hypothetical protein TNCV_1733401 [Trichonephila clavipes]|nr:hypothetical protein TNCV_1733401 [Trichonephila clavipes]
MRPQFGLRPLFLLSGNLILYNTELPKLLLEQCHQPIMKRPNKNAARKLATIKFTNKLRSYGLEHISRRVFDKWKHSTRLKRSSTLQLDSEIRKRTQFGSFLLGVPSEPLIPKNPPKNTCFKLELLQPCSKKKDPVTLRQKRLETIAILSQDNFAIAYTDGSSDRSLSNGGAGIITLLLPDGHEDSPRQDKIICSMQTLPRSSTDAQSHFGMPNRRNEEVTKNGNGPSEDSLRELLYSPDAPRIAEAVIKTSDGI